MPRLPKFIDAEYDIVPEKDSRAHEAYESLMRLAVGSLLFGSEELLKRTRAWEEANPPSGDRAADGEESDLVLLRHLVVGAIFLGPALISRPLVSLAETADRALNLAGNLMGPVTRIPIFKPARGLWGAYQDRISGVIEEFIDKGRREEPYSRAMAKDLLPDIIGDAVVAASEHVDGVQELVRDQVSKYLAYVMEHPEELEKLVQVIGDEYLEYLKEENPEPLQAIIHGQSMSLVGEITDEVRARTVTADSVVEMFVRSLLRRPARQELPLPPPEVLDQARLSTKELLYRYKVEKKDE